MPALQALHEALLTADVDGVQPQQSDFAWGVLSEGSERVARFKELSCDDATGQFVKQVLLAASNHPNPLPEHYNERFDDSPSWSSPSARISAAQGLAALAQKAPAAPHPDVLDAIERLSHDPVAPVRLQARYAARLSLSHRSAAHVEDHSRNGNGGIQQSRALRVAQSPSSETDLWRPSARGRRIYSEPD